MPRGKHKKRKPTFIHVSEILQKLSTQRQQFLISQNLNGAYGNEVAVLLAGIGRKLLSTPSTKLRISEVNFLILANINTTWRIPPEHVWHAADSPEWYL
ncbi:hypothetical protein NPIL_400811 [Nephila pilipes]|uniref:Uncharacterized protein n=1 Tax=Nephila pilipes TaxID=299642 RepID=A0A8X6N7D8_NEPPI|nr:hypothetical protein NPIL_400811 [Nephila pilipes]